MPLGNARLRLAYLIVSSFTDRVPCTVEGSLGMHFTNVIEKRANDAQNLDAFVNVNLGAIKMSVTNLLDLIGKEGIFYEYTRHDISHINKLLEMLEWIIPPATMLKMTPTDCLMTTLGIYFHDLGMIVTRDEFQRRYETHGFASFKTEASKGDSGKDYRDKVARMSIEDSERFLYQEFVREHHASRIRGWISGKVPRLLGAADKVVQEIDVLLTGLNEGFRNDLGLVCESHHLDDLYQLDKYKPSQPYGSSTDETANLQYCAILLRTVDLLHVTKDRAPSITFRTVSPTDPKSIQEWHKQMAVVAVRPKPGVDKEGNVDPTAVQNSIEVHGFFTQPEGFFALTAYLDYAEKQLRKSSEWAQLAKKRKGVPYEFPWEGIDQSNLIAQGFINKQFEFSLDQAKILDLLTGHTLYNDTTVVLRELTQNSLDAVRVRWESETGFITQGRVTIVWDSFARVLTIEDNGSGMTQSIIDHHFLKVGSSLYQDEDFKKLHPGFSAISRFGIGVLSTFMISDEIEVTTCHPDETQARALSLRSLHGKYLIRLIDKEPQELGDIYPHGTQIKLRVRSSAKLLNLPNLLKRWILFPRCEVQVIVDSSAPVNIGFREPKDAILHELSERGLVPEGSMRKDGDVKVEQGTKGGVTVAYALEWNDYFREWAFLSDTRRPSEDLILMTGTCVEGVRVDFSSPGYSSRVVLAIANATGVAAPKTNVARSGLEATAELRQVTRHIYDLYCDHVRSEIDALQKARSFSLTWALGEAAWLLGPLFDWSAASIYNPPGQASDEEGLLEALADIPSIALEENDTRVGVSPKQLSQYPFFWTVDSALMASAETLVREIPAPVAISSLARSFGADVLKLPNGPYISVQHLTSLTDRLAFRSREPEQMVVDRDRRRVDLRWKLVGQDPIWRNGMPQNPVASKLLKDMTTDRSSYEESVPPFRNVYIAEGRVDVSGLKNEILVKTMGRIFVLPGSPYCRYLLELLRRIESSYTPTILVAYLISMKMVWTPGPVANPVEHINRELIDLDRYVHFDHSELTSDQELISILKTTRVLTFDPRAWSRDSDN
jgi:molecular chaperone HtpG